MKPKTETTRKLAVIMFTDIVGYTALMQTDEQQAISRRDRYRSILSDAIAQYSGEIIQYYGDGTLCIFNSAKNAIMGALQIQSELQKEPRVPLRLGLHIGDIVHDQEGIYGDGVNLASRIESLSIPGAVLLSDKMQREIRNHPSIQTVFLGEFPLKNVQDPVGIYALEHDGIVIPSQQDIFLHSKNENKKSVAVLPFINMNANPDHEYFGDGIAEEIINGLTKVENIMIIARSSSFSLKNSGEDACAIGRRLAVSHVLEGSIRIAGNRVRVSVQLINTIDGFQLWSDIFERELYNIFEVQDEIARHVVNMLKENFIPENKNKRIISSPTRNLEAYNSYLKGLHHWNKWNPDEIQKAVGLFDSVIKMDPDFSPAYCALTHCYSFLGSSGVISPAKAYFKAHEYALTAIQKDSGLPEAHLALAVVKFYHFWDWEGTGASLEHAHQLGLNSALMNHTYGLYLATIGKTAEGIHKMERAVHLDPLSIPVTAELGHLYIFDQQYEKALKIFDEILELDSNFRGAVEAKGITYVCMGEYEKALESFSAYHKMVNHPLKGITGMGVVHAELGNEDKVEEYIEILKKRQESDPNVSLEIDFALIYSSQKKYNKAIKYLNRVYDKRFSTICMGMVFILRCPSFKNLWNQSEFKKLIWKMGLEN